MHRVTRARVALYSLAALLSLLLSCWIASRAVVINPDGVCYLQSALAFKNGFAIATHLCEQANWPFYSILIFGLVKLTGWSNLIAAFVINGLCSMLTVLMFIAITELLTTSRRVIALAAAVILLAHTFNGVRGDVIRDHGFWAFYLMSLYFFLRYLRCFTPPFQHQGKQIFALLWSAAIIVATLFRVEGAVFLLLLPLTMFFDWRRKLAARVLSFLQLNTLTIAAGVLLSVWLLTHATHSIGRLPEIQFQIVHGLQTVVTQFHTTAALLGQHVLSVYSREDAASILLVMLCGWYVVSVVSNVTLIYAVLIVYAWCKRLAGLDPAAQLALWAYVCVNVLITLIFLVDHMFLANRYLIALSLVLMLWVPFALENLIQQWRVRKWPLLLALFFIFIYALGGILQFGYSKQYIRAAGDWLAVNVPAQAKIYSNDYQVLYYSQHVGDAIFSKGKEFADLNMIAQGKWQQYDYLALRLSKKTAAQDATILQELKFTPAAIFQNKRADQVRIYRVKH